MKKTNKKTKRTKKSKILKRNRAITALIVNLIIPGLGSIIGRKKHEGLVQLILFIISIPLLIILIGIPLLVAMWLWALITSVQIILEAE